MLEFSDEPTSYQLPPTVHLTYDCSGPSKATLYDWEHNQFLLLKAAVRPIHINLITHDVLPRLEQLTKINAQLAQEAPHDFYQSLYLRAVSFDTKPRSRIFFVDFLYSCYDEPTISQQELEHRLGYAAVDDRGHYITLDISYVPVFQHSDMFSPLADKYYSPVREKISW